MNKRINIRWAVGLIVVSMVFGIGVHFLHAYQQGRHADFFLEKARSSAKRVAELSQELQDSGEPQDAEAPEALTEAFEEAQGFYTRYSALNPDDTDGLAEYGLFLAEYNPSAAYMTLERVLREDPSRSDVRRKVAEVAVGIGRHRDALEHLDGHLLKKAPNDVDLLDLLASCQIVSGEHRAAADTLNKAIELEPSRAELYLRRAVILSSKLEQPEEAEACMQELVDVNAESAQAHVLRGNYLRGVQKHEEASAEAVKALELEPENVDAVVLAMQCALANEDFESARKHALQAIELNPRRFEIYATLCDVETRSGELDEAIAHLREGTEATSGNPYLIFRLTDLLVAKGQLEEAVSSHRKLESAGAPESLCKYIEGRIEFARGHWAAARDAFEVVRPDLPAGFPVSERQVDYWLGRCYRRLGDVENERSVAQRAASENPDWLPARITRAEALVTAGNLDEALREYGKITEFNDAPLSAWLERARLMIADNLRRDEGNRDWDAIDHLLDHAASAWPDSSGVVLVRAQKFLSQGKATDAKELVEKAVESNRDSLSLQLGLAALFESQEDWNEARGVYERIESESGDSVPLRLARARHEVKKNGSNAEAVLPTFAKDASQFSDAQQVSLYSGLANEAARVGARDLARELWERVAEGSPNDLIVRLRLLEMAFEDQDVEQVDRYLEGIRKIEGEGPYWHYGRARRLIALATKQKSKELLDRARKHAGEVQSMRPGWSPGAKLAAMISQLDGDDTGAIENLYSAIERGDRTAETVSRLIQFLSRQGRYEEADRTLRQYEDRIDLSGSLGRLATQLSVRVGDIDRAVKFAREGARGSEEAEDHRWLGQVLAVAADQLKGEQQTDQAQTLLSEATNALRRSLELDDSSPEAWLQLMQLLVAGDDTSAAEALVSEVRTSTASDEDPTLLPRCYEVLGWEEKAQEAFVDASHSERDDPAVLRQVARYQLRRGNFAEAQTALRQLIEGGLEAELEQRMWARRSLATLLDQQANRGEASKEALKLIEENLAIAPSSVADLRVKAYILASSAVPAEREDAIEILDKLVSETAVGKPQDRFQLARAHSRQNQPEKAMEHLRVLIAEHEENTEYLSFHIALLLENEELNEAELWLRQLEEIAPAEWGATALRSELFFARDQFAATRDLLANAAKRVDIQSATGGTEILRFARTAENFGDRLAGTGRESQAGEFIDDAEKLFRRYCAQYPEERLRLASFLGRQRRHEEAVQILEQSWETSSTDSVAFACDPLVRDGLLGSSELARIESVLKKCLEKTPEHHLLLMVLAELYITQKNYDQAEAIYEGMLERDRQGLSAINNLAMLRALLGREVEKSLKSISEAIDVYGSVPHLLDTRALLHLARGDARKALADLKVAGAQRPSASHYFHLAQTYLKLREDESAADALEHATQMGLKPGNLKELHQLERERYEQLRRELN